MGYLLDKPAGILLFGGKELTGRLGTGVLLNY